MHPTLQCDGSLPWCLCYVKPSVSPSPALGSRSKAVKAWEELRAELVHRTQLAVAPLPQARLLDLCSCLPLPVRCRVEDTPMARARPPRTPSWTTLSEAAPVAGYNVLSGIPGTYSSHGIHEPSSRLCCPGGSFGRSQSAGCVFVPMPNTARPEGGCLTIHQSSSHPLPFWLKRLVREELEWHIHKYM